MSTFSNHLILAAQNGEQKAFNELYKKLLPYVKGILVNVSNHNYGAWMIDLAHDITSHILNPDILSRYDLDSNFNAWVGTIAKHKCIDYFKSRKRRENECNMSKLSSNNEGFTLDDLHHTDGKTAESNLFKSEQSHHLMTIVKKHLSEDMQTIIRLWYFEEFDQHEISKITGWTVSKVGVLHLRAKQKLKELLQREIYRYQ